MRIASLEVTTLRNNETVLSTAPKSDLSTPTLQFFWSTFLKPEFTYVLPSDLPPFQKPSGVKRKAQVVQILAERRACGRQAERRA